jgi:hypothetical protein
MPLLSTAQRPQLLLLTSCLRLLPLLLLAVSTPPPLQLRDHAPEGKLPWLDGGFKDWEHFHGTSFGSYNLWVARDELVPQVSEEQGAAYDPSGCTAAI